MVRKAADALEGDAPQEECWCCSKCGFEPKNEAVKWCEKCGGQMDTSTHIAWDSESEMFEALDLVFYPETDYGSIAGINAGGKSVKAINNFQQELFELFGNDVDIMIMSGEYYH